MSFTALKTENKIYENSPMISSNETSIESTVYSALFFITTQLISYKTNDSYAYGTKHQYKSICNTPSRTRLIKQRIVKLG